MLLPRMAAINPRFETTMYFIAFTSTQFSVSRIDSYELRWDTLGFALLCLTKASDVP